MFIKSILTYIYLIISFISLIIIYIIKCHYNNNVIDKFIYLNKNPTNLNIYTYYLSNSLLFFIYGIIFGIRNIHFMILKIIIYDSSLFIIKYCNINNINFKSESFKYSLIAVIKTIILSIASYYTGTLISNNLYNIFFDLNNKFNIKISYY